jgi:hypothetical protein
MEQEQLQQDIFGAEINEEGTRNLSAISQWMQINAITAFVSLAVSVTSTILLIVKLSSMDLGSDLATGSMLQMIIPLIISIILNVILLQAAANIKKGVQLTDQGYLNKGLGKMAAYFKMLGIVVIVTIALVILVMLFTMTQL